MDKQTKREFTNLKKFIKDGFKTQDERMDAKLKTQDAKMDTKFKTQDERIDAKFKTQDGKIDAKFKAQDERIDVKFKAQDVRIAKMIDEKIGELALMVKQGFDENTKEHAEIFREIEALKLKLSEKVDRVELEKHLFSLRQS